MNNISRIKAMLAVVEREYANHAVRDENGLYTPERLNKSIRLHERIATLKEVLQVMADQEVQKINE